MEKTIEIEGRVFTYVNTDRDNGALHYKLEYVPKSCKSSRTARLEVFSSGKIFKLMTEGGGFGSRAKDRMSYGCTTPDGREFLVGGTFSEFANIYGISETEIKRSSRTRKPTPQGWQFKRFDGVVC